MKAGSEISPHLSCSKKMHGNKNRRKKENNKSKAVSSYRMAKHTVLMMRRPLMGAIGWKLKERFLR